MSKNVDKDNPTNISDIKDRIKKGDEKLKEIMDDVEKLMQKHNATGLIVINHPIGAEPAVWFEGELVDIAMLSAKTTGHLKSILIQKLDDMAKP